MDYQFNSNQGLSQQLGAIVIILIYVVVIREFNTKYWRMVHYNLSNFISNFICKQLAQQPTFRKQQDRCQIMPAHQVHQVLSSQIVDNEQKQEVQQIQLALLQNIIGNMIQSIEDVFNQLDCWLDVLSEVQNTIETQPQKHMTKNYNKLDVRQELLWTYCSIRDRVYGSNFDKISSDLKVSINREEETIVFVFTTPSETKHQQQQATTTNYITPVFEKYERLLIDAVKRTELVLFCKNVKMFFYDLQQNVKYEGIFDMLFERIIGELEQVQTHVFVHFIHETKFEIRSVEVCHWSNLLQKEESSDGSEFPIEEYSKAIERLKYRYGYKYEEEKQVALDYKEQKCFKDLGRKRQQFQIEYINRNSCGSNQSNLGHQEARNSSEAALDYQKIEVSSNQYRNEEVDSDELQEQKYEIEQSIPQKDSSVLLSPSDESRSQEQMYDAGASPQQSKQLLSSEQMNQKQIVPNNQTLSGRLNFVKYSLSQIMQQQSQIEMTKPFDVVQHKKEVFAQQSESIQQFSNSSSMLQDIISNSQQLHEGSINIYNDLSQISQARRSIMPNSQQQQSYASSLTSSLSLQSQQQEQYQIQTPSLSQHQQNSSKIDLSSMIIFRDDPGQVSNKNNEECEPVGILLSVWFMNSRRPFVKSSTAFLISKNELVSCHHSIHEPGLGVCQQIIFFAGRRNSMRNSHSYRMRMKDCHMRTTFEDTETRKYLNSGQFVILHMNVSIRMSSYLHFHTGSLMDKEIRIIGYRNVRVVYSVKRNRFKVVGQMRNEVQGEFISYNQAQLSIKYDIITFKGMSGGPILSKYRGKNGSVQWRVIGIHTNGRKQQQFNNQGMFICTKKMGNLIKLFRKQLKVQAEYVNNRRFNSEYSCVTISYD